MGRVEALIFASAKPVLREALARVVGKRFNLDALIEDIRAGLGDRLYELVDEAGGWRHRTRTKYADAIRCAAGSSDRAVELSQLESLVVTAIGYFQPITLSDVSEMLGREISRDTLANLRLFGLIANGPRSPRGGAPNTYVTTPGFLSQFGLNTLQEPPDREAIETERLQYADTHDGYETVDLFGRNLGPSDAGYDEASEGGFPIRAADTRRQP